jgi:CBS domain-containing protein
MNVRDFVRSQAITCPPQASLSDVASLMREYDIGSVVVVDDHGHVVGIATDRDITVRGVSHSLEPATPIAKVMSPEVTWIDEGADVFEAATAMASGTLRRLPVLDATGRLTGVVSLDDLASLFVMEVTKLVRVVGAEASERARMEPTLEPRGTGAT